MSKFMTLERGLVFLEQPKASSQEATMSIIVGKLVEFTKLKDLEKLVIAATEPEYFLGLPELFELAFQYYSKLERSHWIRTKYKDAPLEAYSDFHDYQANNKLLWEPEVESEISIAGMLNQIKSKVTLSQKSYSSFLLIFARL